MKEYIITILLLMVASENGIRVDSVVFLILLGIIAFIWISALTSAIIKATKK